MAPGVDVMPNRSSPPAILPREAWREGKRIRRRTVADLSGMPPVLVDAVRAALAGGMALPSADAAISVRRSLPHGHVAAVPGTLRSPGPVRVLGRGAGRMRDLAVAAAAARIPGPAPKPATARALSPETASTSLGTALGLGPVTGNRMLDMPGWLLVRQPWTGRSLASRYLKDGGAPILHDVSSSCLEGRRCPLAAFGHNRDGKKGKLRITYGLLCAADGCPVAVEVFPGSTSDPSTVASQVRRVRRRLRIDRVALAGGRGHADDGPHPRGSGAGGAGLDPSPEDTGHKEAAGGGRGRRAGPGGAGPRRRGGGHRPGLSRRAADGLHEPPAAQGAGPETGGPAAGQGEGAGGGRRVGALRPTEGPAGHRPPGGPGHQPEEGRQAPGGRGHRRVHLLEPQGGPDRGRGEARRRVRHPHQPGRGGHRNGGGGRGMQVTRDGGAGVQEREGRSPEPPGIRVFGGPRRRPCVPVHAGAVCRVAHAAASGAHAFRG